MKRISIAIAGSMQFMEDSRIQCLGGIDMRSGRKSRIYTKIVSLILISAVLQLYGFSAFAQRSPSLSLALDSVKIHSTALSTFAGTYADWVKQYAALRKTVKPNPSQIASFSAISSTVLRQLPSYQSNLTAYISKLKGAQAWTVELDNRYYDFAAKNNIDPAVVAQIRQWGGPRMVLEKALTDAPQLPNDLNRTVAQFKGLAWFNLNFVKEAMARDQERLDADSRSAVAFAALGIVCAAFALVLCVVVTTAGAAIALADANEASK